MRKMITCSFDDLGVVMTAWNGVHPDRNGHFSVTKTLSREDYNKACKNRALFSDILGVDITQGWQNALADAIKNASDLKIDMHKMAEFYVELLTARFGEEKAKEIFAELEKQNTDIESAVRAKLDEAADKEEAEKAKKTIEKGGTNEPDKTGTGTTESTGKGNKKSRRKTDPGTSDETGADTPV